MLIRRRRTALSKTPHALADGLMLVFQHPDNGRVQGLKIPCSLLQGIFDRKESGLFCDSLAYPAARGGECARFRGSIEIIA